MRNFLRLPQIALIFAVMTFSLFAFSGCGIAYQHARARVIRDGSPADFGPPPGSDWHVIASAMIRQNVNPDAAKFQYGEPRREAMQLASSSPVAKPVWITNVEVTAKDVSGTAITKSLMIAWHDRKILAYCLAPSDPDTLPPWEYLDR